MAAKFEGLNQENVLKQENWLKGSKGLTQTKNALIPFLEEHFRTSSEKWETSDNHTKHLFKLASQKNVKRTNKDGQIWNVDCDGCKPILDDLVKCHWRPERLTWNNNTDETLSMPDETRLAKALMSGGNADCLSLNDRDSLAILEVCRNNVRLGLDSSLLSYLILFRNRIMHTKDNCIKEDELADAFSNMKQLLECDQLKDRKECIDAAKELSELLGKNMLCEIDKSNPIWKEAISIQKIANEQDGSKPPIDLEELEQLLKDTKSELEKKNQRMKRKFQNTERVLNETNRNLQTSRIREQTERSQAESAESARQDSKYNQQGIKKVKLQEDELKKHNPTLAGRVVKGAATGTGVGFCCGGPLAAAVGGAAGGAVGGLSYFWDVIVENKQLSLFRETKTH